MKRAAKPDNVQGGRADRDKKTMKDKPKRRWYQYSLRSLFVLMTLFALVCSWYAYEMQKAAKRRAAIAEIEKLGGEVQYYDPSDPATPGKPPRWFSWLRQLHGDEHLGNAVGVFFWNTQTTDAGLEHLKDLPKLSLLYLRSTQITNAGLEHLKSLKNLILLDIKGTQVTDEGVEKLQEALPYCTIKH